MFSPVVMASPEVEVEPLVKVKLTKFPVAPSATESDESARVLMLPVVVIEVVPNPVAAILPEVGVRERAPVVRVKPFDAVSVWVLVSEPLLVVVTPVRPRESEVALVLPM